MWRFGRSPVLFVAATLTFLALAPQAAAFHHPEPGMMEHGGMDHGGMMESCPMMDGMKMGGMEMDGMMNPSGSMGSMDRAGDMGSMGGDMNRSMHECPGMMNASALRALEGPELERTYLLRMLHHHLGGVAMAQLAERRAEDPRVVSLARNITDTQMREVGTIRGWLSQWYDVDLPSNAIHLAANGTALQGSQWLMNRTGRDFDRGFVEAMREHHDGAIEASRAIEGRAVHPEVDGFARSVIASQSAENEAMRGWEAEWARETERPQEAMGEDARTPAVGILAVVAAGLAVALLARRRR